LRVDSLAEGFDLTTKNATALATLVPAVPAALLGSLLVYSFLKSLDPLQKLGTMYVALYGTTLAACAGVVFLPIAVLIFGPRAAKSPKSGELKAAPKSGTVKSSAAEEESSAGESAVEESASSESALDESGESLGDESTAAPKGKSRPMSTGELEVVEPTPSMDSIAAYDDEAMPPSGEMPAVEDEDFAFEDEEPEPPKKKKGK
jgi:hypothetical protein